jgi:hypothetical protein
MRPRSYWLCLLIGAMVWIAPTRAHAAEFCVTNSTELGAALVQATLPAQERSTTTIKLQRGSYPVGGTLLAQNNPPDLYALELLGGYESGCGSRIINPDNTIFDGGGGPRFLFHPQKNLTIEGVRMQNIAGVLGALEVEFMAEDVTVSLRNNAFVGVGVSVVALSDFDDGSVVQFLNHRVHGFPGSASQTSPAVYFAGIERVRITGNTIADNAGADGLTVCSVADVWLLNNIGWNNAGLDFEVISSCGGSAAGNARFRNNIATSVLLNPVSDSGNNLDSDPLFINAAAGNYRVSNVSPAVNSGVVSSSTTALDLAGNPRIVGSTVDRGAYETALDDTIPTTIIVTNTNDAGAGSLRQALLDANANPDFSFIRFDIPGSCPRVITLASNLPLITQGVQIDGFSQPGSTSNTFFAGDNATRCVVLEGSNARSTGLNFGGASGTQFWLQGIALSGFKATAGDGAALRVSGGTGNLIRGNQIGGRLSSAAGSFQLNGNDHGIVLNNLSRSTVGGDLDAHRNVIADGSGNGIWITTLNFGPISNSSNGNEINNNLIGAYGREVSSPNLCGIKVDTSDNAVRHNAILFNDLDGILMDVAAAHSNLIESNRIGRRNVVCFPPCSLAGGNGRHGVSLFFGPHDNQLIRNTIRDNVQAGIAIGSSSGAVSARNALIGNSLYDNGAQGMAFTVYNGADNDAGAAQANMANRGQNYPVLSRALGGARSGEIQGTLATINGAYSIEVYSSAAPDPLFGRGEAERFQLRFFSVTVSNATPGQNGSASFRIPFSNASGSLIGRVITVTATDVNGNTSELSAPVVFESDVIFASGFEN